VGPGEIFFPVLQLYRVNIIPQMVQYSTFMCAAVTATKGRSPEIFSEAIFFFGNTLALEGEVFSHFTVLNELR
jgi:hypothetical protein